MHFEDVLVVAEDAVNLRCCLVFLAGHRAGVVASKGDDFAAGVRIAFARDHGRAHVVNPDAAVFLPDIVVAGETDSVKRFAHEFATELLLNEAALECPGAFRGAFRDRGRCLRVHPHLDFSVPIADERFERLVGGAGRAGRLSLLHHLFQFGIQFLRRSFVIGPRQTGEECPGHDES